MRNSSVPYFRKTSWFFSVHFQQNGLAWGTQLRYCFWLIAIAHLAQIKPYWLVRSQTLSFPSSLWMIWSHRSLLFLPFDCWVSNIKCVFSFLCLMCYMHHRGFQASWYNLFKFHSGCFHPCHGTRKDTYAYSHLLREAGAVSWHDKHHWDKIRTCSGQVRGRTGLSSIKVANKSSTM